MRSFARILATAHDDGRHPGSEWANCDGRLRFGTPTSFSRPILHGSSCRKFHAAPGREVETSGSTELQFLPNWGIRMNKSVNVLALVKNGHRYVFLYDDESQDTVLGQLSASAGDPELDFSWYDAAILAQRVRKMTEERAQYDTLSPMNDAA